MNKIKTCVINLLETSTVTLSVGEIVTDYPLSRLYNRDIERNTAIVAQDSTAIIIKIVQGGTIKSADRLLIPAGHTLDGMTLSIQYSDNDVTYTDTVAPWVQSGSALINKSWSTLNYTYWRFIIENSAVNPQLGELILTSTYEWTLNPFFPISNQEDLFNSVNTVSPTGQDDFVEFGDSKKHRIYHTGFIALAQKQEFDSLDSVMKSSKPIWLCDEDSNWIFVIAHDDIVIDEISDGLYSTVFDFIEVLG